MERPAKQKHVRIRPTKNNIDTNIDGKEKNERWEKPGKEKEKTNMTRN